MKQAQQLEVLATSGVRELQRMVTGLHPPHLDDLGLLAAIRWYANEVSQRYNIPINIYYQGEKPRLTTEMRATIFRIVQEAITNTIRHANASQISISLTYAVDHIKLQISDDGQGFDVDKILAEQSDGSPAWGLLGIFERTSLVNGTCSILSTPGQGTTVELTVPIIRKVKNA
jgi:signal transduction histidine kinase